MSEGEGTGPAVFLHIGTPKSGTTYLQARVNDNQDLAREQGLLWPGPRWAAHVQAVRDLRSVSKGDAPDPAGPWMQMVDVVRSWSGPKALISMEWLSGAEPHQVDLAKQTLGLERLHIVCTARDLLRSFVAQWQEMTKNGRPWSWQQYVDETFVKESGRAYERLWNQQDLPAILSKWGEGVPRDRIHVVTVPPRGSDPELLWQRFCSVLQIDGRSFVQPAKDNESIGVVSAVLMYRLGIEASANGLTHDDFEPVFHRTLADKILAPRRGLEPPLSVSADIDARIRARAQAMVDEVHALGVDVAGDLADLLPGDPLTGLEPDKVTDDAVLDLAIEALVSLGMRQHETVRTLREQNRDLRRQVARLRQRLDPSTDRRSEQES